MQITLRYSIKEKDKEEPHFRSKKITFTNYNALLQKALEGFMMHRFQNPKATIKIHLASKKNIDEYSQFLRGKYKNIDSQLNADIKDINKTIRQKIKSIVDDTSKKKTNKSAQTLEELF